MTKSEAIKAAQEKANLSKQNQMVFRYIVGIEMAFDYTHESLWERRRFRAPTATEVIVVTLDTTGQRNL